jgi:predicted Rdx family selenoprotein
MLAGSILLIVSDDFLFRRSVGDEALFRVGLGPVVAIVIDGVARWRRRRTGALPWHSVGLLRVVGASR